MPLLPAPEKGAPPRHLGAFFWHFASQIKGPLLLALFFTITIVGFPLAVQHMKLVKVALLPFGHEIASPFGEPKQADGIGHGGSVLAHTRSDGLMRETVILVEALERLRLFHGVQVLSLKVLDQRQLQSISGSRTGHDDRDRAQLRQLGGAPSPLPDHQLVALSRPAYHDWLQNAVPPE